MSIKINVITAGIRQRNILIVEDDPSMAEQIPFVLKNPCYKFFCVKTGGEGLDILMKKKIHLILLNLGLPDMHGADFLKEKNNNEYIAAIPTILVTAEKSDKIIQQYKDIGGFFNTYKFDEHFIESLIFMVRSALAYYDKCLEIQSKECHVKSQLCGFRSY